MSFLCPNCSSENVKRVGTTLFTDGIYRCSDCGKKFRGALHAESKEDFYKKKRENQRIGFYLILIVSILFGYSYFKDKHFPKKEIGPVAKYTDSNNILFNPIDATIIESTTDVTYDKISYEYFHLDSEICSIHNNLQTVFDQFYIDYYLKYGDTKSIKANANNLISIIDGSIETLNELGNVKSNSQEDSIIVDYLSANFQKKKLSEAYEEEKDFVNYVLKAYKRKERDQTYIEWAERKSSHAFKIFYEVSNDLQYMRKSIIKI